MTRRRQKAAESGAATPDFALVASTEWPVSDLREPEYNPRVVTDEELAAIESSLTRFGLVQDLVVNTRGDRRGVVVGGSQRLKVARSRGQDRVTVKEVDLDLEAERELNVRLNGNTGSWDYGRLAAGFNRDALAAWGVRASDLLGVDQLVARAAQEQSLSRGLSAIQGVIDGATAEAPANGGHGAVSFPSFGTLLLTGPRESVERCRAILQATQDAHQLGTMLEAALMLLEGGSET